MAVYRFKVLKLGRDRDYFPAQIAAVQMNRGRTKESDKVWTAEDFLPAVYPPSKDQSVIITHDPDRGAAGNWQALRSNLKGTTETAKAKMAKRKIHRA